MRSRRKHGQDYIVCTQTEVSLHGIDTLGVRDDRELYQRKWPANFTKSEGLSSKIRHHINPDDGHTRIFKGNVSLFN